MRLFLRIPFTVYATPFLSTQWINGLHRNFLTEYMPGGNLYDFLHKYNNVLELPLLLKFAIDISRGMDYLHRNNIIHRDLKSANLLLDIDNVRSSF